jgi:hypothetical protein
VFLTRSIRRKLVLSLALVSAMLALLAFGAISGLWSYRNVVNDLDYTINSAPGRGDLLAAIAQLNDPLLMPEWKVFDEEGSRRELWHARIKEAREEILHFSVRLDRTPPVENPLGTAGRRQANAQRTGEATGSV